MVIGRTKAEPDAGARNGPPSNQLKLPEALEEAATAALRLARRRVHYPIARAAEHLAVRPAKSRRTWSGSGAEVVCDRVSRRVWRRWGSHLRQQISPKPGSVKLTNSPHQVHDGKGLSLVPPPFMQTGLQQQFPDSLCRVAS
eukprot:scaffold44918_cov63-Phaeocystis_antarctica.AAC.2